MARSAFGRWGAGLDRDDFACALAAAGVAGGDPDELGEFAFAHSDRALPWHLPSVAAAEDGDPERLREAWRALAADPPERPLRLAVGEWPPELRTPAWLLGELARGAVGLDGVYLESPVPHPVRWSWPLQVAILDDGRSELRERLAADPPWTVTEFAELVEPEAPEPCDLLIVPARLRAAVARMLPAPITASAVVLLERLDEQWRRARALVETLLADAEAGALAFAPVRGDPAAWLHFVLETLAHDEGLDVALLAAARARGLPAPLVLAEPRLLDETRMSRVRDRMSTRMRDAVAMADGGGPPLEAMADTVASAPPFEHETAGARVIAHASREARELLPLPEPRFLQVDVLEHRDGRGPVRARALRPATLHEVVVHVGPRDTELLAGDKPFPEGELPPAEEHRLTVVLTSPTLLEEPQTGEIVLQRSGPSTPCSFWLRAPTKQGPVEARVIVLHEGRVLQTALLSGEVAAGDVAAERLLRLRLEALVHPTSDLAGRTRFDAAFVLNHDREGVERTTTIVGDEVEVHESAEFREALDFIEADLEDAITSEDDVALRGERTRKLLVTLAQQGSTLCDELLDLKGGRTLAAAERLQVLSLRPERLFPLEFAYDRTWPANDAQLCPNAERALETGRCDDCPSLTSDGHVCPLGFWCLSKIIERQAHDPEATPDDGADFHVFANAAIEGRKRLRALTGSLFAASDNADRVAQGTTQSVMDALSTATGAGAVRVQTWSDWTERVAESSPPLLVVLPHTLKDGRHMLMEIGASEHLAFGQIKASHVGEQLPVTLLLGCSTAETTIPFQRFTTAFRRRGAAVVIATLTKVLGRHSGRVTARLVAELAERARTRPVTLGELMRDVRRSLLLAGVPTVLAVTAFGDADWILGPTEGG